MTNRKWHGAMLYLVLMGATSTAVGLRTHSDVQLTDQPAAVHSTTSTGNPSSTSTTSRSGTKSSSTSTSTTPGAPKVVTIKGDVVSTRYGPVQVSVTFSNKKITAVKTLQTPSGDGHSRAIADRAVPTLHDEVIASQSAHIDTVSGATYTSDGYAQSVQSAIDQL
jgi:uncharacterized protein with FMN-binding domain